MGGKNGYVKPVEYPVIGNYNFEYVLFEDEDGVDLWVNSCSVLDELSDNDTINEIKAACEDKADTRIEITENGRFKVIEPEETSTWKYLINERGELLVTPLETNVNNSAFAGVYYNFDYYKLENGRIYLKNLTLSSGAKVTGVYKK